ncbi:membrane protein [Streptomyces antibioticus]|nr:membrane protein [Streptomyces antibioticus]
MITAACSSDSGDSKAKSGGGSSASAGAGSSQPSASASPTVQAAAYDKLPDACAVLSKKTLADLVPQAAKSGKKGSSDEPSSRASCSWNSLDNNGVKGSQFRWLNVSLLRFDSDVTRGSGDDQAHTFYARQVKDVQAVDGAKGTKAIPLSGTGAEAMAVRYDLKKKEGLFKQQTVVARVENVVVTVDYNGAGLAGEKTPDADDLTKAAEKALKEVVASVSSANGAGGKASSPASPSKSASPSKTSSKSPSAGASPSGSAAKKS